VITAASIPIAAAHLGNRWTQRTPAPDNRLDNEVGSRRSVRALCQRGRLRMCREC
jgi:hypothetical protein